ncbi:GNAT family N-acetyltransferase [Cellulosimicrobium sp. PMB13]|uniref:GNAT family N-acetyltransferase n=1 Tax=Cellulosimicrobium sp. PMB13 TaxID=3120158 RepID=UPI003F4B6D7E
MTKTPPNRRLVPPTTDLFPAWRDARDDWGPGLHEDGFGLGLDDDVASPAGFAAWVSGVGSAVAATLWWVVVERDDGTDDVVGGIALRHPDHPGVAQLGHVGYGIRPGARRQGHAAWALTRVLGVAADTHGMDHVDLVCEEGNHASAGLAEKLGGVRHGHSHPGVVRYRVPVAGSDPASTRVGQLSSSVRSATAM